MRFLLISDTHGKLGIINELVAETQADAVIHAGDFGFYEDDSYERLSERELRLHVDHSTLPSENDPPAAGGDAWGASERNSRLERGEMVSLLIKSNAREGLPAGGGDRRERGR